MARIALLDLNGGKPNEAVGLLCQAIRAAGHGVAMVDVLAGEPLPEQADALLTTGGPGSPLAPGAWQAPLRARLRQALLDETPLLTICLGFQIVAGELGSRVAQLAHPRFGIFDLALTPAGRSDPLARACAEGAAFEQRRWAVWGGDLIPLAFGPEGDITCGRLGPRAWGCVFHPEATTAALAAWLDRPEPARKLRARQGDQDHAATLARIPRVDRVHSAVIGGWLACLG